MPRAEATQAIACRPGCGACCIAPSISTPIPGRGGQPARPKPAGQRCVQLDDSLRCRLFGRADRPAVCSSLQPHPLMCRDSAAAALRALSELEAATCPRASAPRS
jgi:Fe-S-cluster containining protein